MAKKKTVRAKVAKFIPCHIAELPPEQQVAAAANAVALNPANAPRMESVFAMSTVAFTGSDDVGNAVLEPSFLAVLTGKYWGSSGVNLSVSFLDTQQAALINKILAHMNAWGDFANVRFSWSQSGGDVRIARGNTGYWSYLGTDIKLIGAGQATMNLQGFTVNTSDDEYKRVVRHETGHTLGCPHEQQRRAIVERLDVAKTIAFFRQNQGWSESQTRSNVLVPLEERSITGSTETDETSILCYALPASITKDGKPIPGGSDFSSVDRAFAAKLYPKAVQPPPPPPPPPPSESQDEITLRFPKGFRLPDFDCLVSRAGAATMVNVVR